MLVGGLYNIGKVIMTDAQTLDFAISIAEISGVFVGFGVLIGAVQSRDLFAPEKKALAQGVSLLDNP